MAFNAPPSGSYIPSGSSAYASVNPSVSKAPVTPPASAFYSVSAGSSSGASFVGSGWVPSAEETPYYDHLFLLADVSRTQSIKGREAVSFFSKSSLPVTSLKQIWSLSDRRSASELNRADFAYACRLIALAQNGITIGVGAVESNTHIQALPKFEGIEVPVIKVANASPAPSPVAHVGSDTFAGAAADPWSVSTEEREKYLALFKSMDSDNDGKLTGAEAVQFFKKSGLPQSDLRTIWNLSDIDKDGNLDADEFVVAFHLSVKVSKGGLSLPTSLPPAIVPPSKLGLLGLPVSTSHATSSDTIAPPTPAAAVVPNSVSNLPAPFPVNSTMSSTPTNSGGIDMGMMNPVVKAAAGISMAAPTPAMIDSSSVRSSSPASSMMVASSGVPMSSNAPVTTGPSVLLSKEDYRAISSISKTIEEAGKSLSSDLEKVVTDADATNKALREQLQILTSSVEKQKQAKLKAMAKLSELNAEKESLLAEIKEKGDAFKEECSQLEEIESAVEELRESVTELRNKRMFQIEMISEEKEKISGQLVEKKIYEAQLATLQAEIDAAQAEKDKLNSTLSSSMISVATMTGEAKELDAIKLAHSASARANDAESNAAAAVIASKKKLLDSLRSGNTALSNKVVSQAEEVKKAKVAVDRSAAAAADAAKLHQDSIKKKESVSAELSSVSSDLDTVRRISPTVTSTNSTTKVTATSAASPSKKEVVVAEPAPPVVTSSVKQKETASSPSFSAAPASDDEGVDDGFPSERFGAAPAAFDGFDVKGDIPSFDAFGSSSDVATSNSSGGFDDAFGSTSITSTTAATIGDDAFSASAFDGFGSSNGATGDGFDAFGTTSSGGGTNSSAFDTSGFDSSAFDSAFSSNSNSATKDDWGF